VYGAVGGWMWGARHAEDEAICECANDDVAVGLRKWHIKENCRHGSRHLGKVYAFAVQTINLRLLGILERTE
jgi:hypothetical protein